MKYVIWIIPVSLLVLLSACGQDPPPQVGTDAPKRAAAAIPSPIAEVTQEIEAVKEAANIYDPAGRRDPFEPLLMVRRPVLQSEGPLTPLQAFDVGQLRLTGIIIGKGDPRAMVVAPDGKAYILHRGILVGKNNGVVKDIVQGSVLVEERYYDFSGEIRKNVLEITLPKREGV